MNRITTAVVLAAALSAGCVTARLRDEAARVFRYHNGVASEVLLTLPELAETAPAAHERLAADERRMLEACAPLNALAVAHRDERARPAAGGLRLRSVLRECETATAAVEATLGEIG